MFSRVLFLVIYLGISTGLPAKQHRIANGKIKPPAPKTEILFETNYDKQAIGNYIRIRRFLKTSNLIIFLFRNI